MARLISLLTLYITHSLCMEMRETVERMVMVRTTGSDLQPAATGYIYKKENDGKPSVIEMGESEVMEHLAKLYEQPKAFAAPLAAAGSFFVKEDDSKEESKHAARVIPVTEDKEVDGIANEDFRKIFEEYGAKTDDHHKTFDDYLHGDFDHGPYKYRKDNDDEKGYKDYKINHQYGDGDADNYHTAKFERYVVTGGNKKVNDESDIFGKLYKHDDGEKGIGYGYKTDHDNYKINGFQKNDKSDEKTDHSFYDDEPIGSDYHQFSKSSKYAGADEDGNKNDQTRDYTRYAKSEEHGEESREHPTAVRTSESESSDEGQSASDNKSGQLKRKSYGFKIKH